jgi:hypothetical protein
MGQVGNCLLDSVARAGYDTSRVYRQASVDKPVASTHKNVEQTCSEFRVRDFQVISPQAAAVDDRTGKALREYAALPVRVAPERFRSVPPEIPDRRRFVTQVEAARE